MIPCVRANKTIEDILQDTGATEYQVWLSDTLENNYRFKIDPNYKISRQSQPKPKWYWSIKEFLKRQWNAQLTEGQEADDALGISQTMQQIEVDLCSNLPQTIICSIDKDLLQVPGLHYNFVTKVHREISETEGFRNLYTQLITGDRVDDIKGVKGLGPVKASGLLRGADTQYEMFKRVRSAYKDDERLLKNGQLLWVRRKEGEIWSFPEQDETIIQDETWIDSDPTD